MGYGWDERRKEKKTAIFFANFFPLDSGFLSDDNGRRWSGVVQQGSGGCGGQKEINNAQQLQFHLIYTVSGGSQEAPITVVPSNRKRLLESMTTATAKGRGL
jgi:hypothetical protein